MKQRVLPEKSPWRMITYFFRFGGIFMLMEALFHFSGVRLTGASQFWPESAITFVYFYHALWASASLFMAGTFWWLGDNVKRNQVLMIPLAAFFLFHGFILCAFAASRMTELLPVAALSLWHPYYDFQLVIEGGLLVFGAVCLIRAHLWEKRQSLPV